MLKLVVAWAVLIHQSTLEDMARKIGERVPLHAPLVPDPQSTTYFWLREGL